jgi:hypothetical protein
VNKPKRQQKAGKAVRAAHAGPANGEKPYSDEDLLRALNHHLRGQILRLLHSSREPLGPAQIERELKLDPGHGNRLSDVSYHTKVLAKFNAVSMVGTRMVRGATEHFYASLVSDATWVRGLLSRTQESDEAALWPNGRNQGGERTPRGKRP